MEQKLFNLDEKRFVAVVPAETMMGHKLYKIVLMDEEEGWLQDIVNLVYMPKELDEVLMLQIYSNLHDDSPTDIMNVPLNDKMNSIINHDPEDD